MITQSKMFLNLIRSKFLRKKDRTNIKIFQIGFNKCGTKTISIFFKKSGYLTVHYGEGRLATSMEYARRRKQPLLTYYNFYQVFTDMEAVPVFPKEKVIKFKGLKVLETPIYAYKYYELLDRQYPNSKFILNTRPIDKWILSRLRHGNGKYRFTCMHGLKHHESEELIIHCWKNEWNEHHRNVRNYFSKRQNDFVEYNIETDHPIKLAKFFNLSVEHWEHHNKRLK